jgi:L-amino acid N-acyltransferase YncA
METRTAAAVAQSYRQRANGARQNVIALPQDVSLRPATAADAAALAALYAPHVASGTATFELEPPDASEMERRWREVAGRGLPYLVAVYDSEVLGYAYAAPYRPRAAYRFTLEDSIYLRDDARGKGIGRALLTALIDACERFGARQMIAVIGDSGNAASIGVHAALGFRHVGVLGSVGNKFSRWLDVVLMQRALGPGDGAPA